MIVPVAMEYPQEKHHNRFSRPFSRRKSQSSRVGSCDLDGKEKLPITHLFFVLPGTGPHLESERPAGAFIKQFNKLENMMTKICSEYFQDQRANIAMKPITYHYEMHGLKTTDRRMNKITLPTIPWIRSLNNNILGDILYWFTQHHGTKLIEIVTNKLNEAYAEFMTEHPDFCGKICLVCHSLGGLICYDILYLQRRFAQLSAREAGEDTGPELPPLVDRVENPATQTLNFEPNCLFTMGTPLGGTMVFRNMSFDQFTIPCRYHNIFQPYDPFGYRTEPLANDTYIDEPALPITGLPENRALAAATISMFDGFSRPLVSAGKRLPKSLGVSSNRASMAHQQIIISSKVSRESLKVPPANLYQAVLASNYSKRAKRSVSFSIPILSQIHQKDGKSLRGSIDSQKSVTSFMNFSRQPSENSTNMATSDESPLSSNIRPRGAEPSDCGEKDQQRRDQNEAAGPSHGHHGILWLKHKLASKIAGGRDKRHNSNRSPYLIPPPIVPPSPNHCSSSSPETAPASGPLSRHFSIKGFVKRKIADTEGVLKSTSPRNLMFALSRKRDGSDSRSGSGTPPVTPKLRSVRGDRLRRKGVIENSGGLDSRPALAKSPGIFGSYQNRQSRRHFAHHGESVRQDPGCKEVGLFAKHIFMPRLVRNPTEPTCSDKPHAHARNQNFQRTRSSVCLRETADKPAKNEDKAKKQQRVALPVNSNKIGTQHSRDQQPSPPIESAPPFMLEHRTARYRQKPPFRDISPNTMRRIARILSDDSKESPVNRAAVSALINQMEKTINDSSASYTLDSQHPTRLALMQLRDLSTAATSLRSAPPTRNTFSEHLDWPCGPPSMASRDDSYYYPTAPIQFTSVETSVIVSPSSELTGPAPSAHTPPVEAHKVSSIDVDGARFGFAMRQVNSAAPKRQEDSPPTPPLSQSSGSYTSSYRSDADGDSGVCVRKENERGCDATTQKTLAADVTKVSSKKSTSGPSLARIPIQSPPASRDSSVRGTQGIPVDNNDDDDSCDAELSDFVVVEGSALSQIITAANGQAAATSSRTATKYNPNEQHSSCRTSLSLSTTNSTADKGEGYGDDHLSPLPYSERMDYVIPWEKRHLTSEYWLGLKGHFTYWTDKNVMYHILFHSIVHSYNEQP